jgi:hypothetical protein
MSIDSGEKVFRRGASLFSLKTIVSDNEFEAPNENVLRFATEQFGSYSAYLKVVDELKRLDFTKDI